MSDLFFSWHEGAQPRHVLDLLRHGVHVLLQVLELERVVVPLLLEPAHLLVRGVLPPPRLLRRPLPLLRPLRRGPEVGLELRHPRPVELGALRGAPLLLLELPHRRALPVLRARDLPPERLYLGLEPLRAVLEHRVVLARGRELRLHLQLALRPSVQQLLLLRLDLLVQARGLLLRLLFDLERARPLLRELRLKLEEQLPRVLQLLLLLLLLHPQLLQVVRERVPVVLRLARVRARARNRLVQLEHLVGHLLQRGLRLPRVVLRLPQVALQGLRRHVRRAPELLDLSDQEVLVCLGGGG